MNFDAFVSDIEKNHWNMHGVEVYKNNQLLYNLLYYNLVKKYITEILHFR